MASTATSAAAAVSAFAPPRRNSFLKHQRSSSISSFAMAGGVPQSTTMARATGASSKLTSFVVGLCWMAWRFWKNRGVGDNNDNPTSMLLLQKISQILQSIRQYVQPWLEQHLVPRFAAITKAIRTIPLLDADDETKTTTRSLSRQTNNHSMIRSSNEVLKYWFGQFPPEVAQRKLWMVASSSVERQEHVDAEIVDRFQHVLIELTNNDGGWMKHHNNEQPGVFGAMHQVAAIVVLDQFSRHIHRYYKNRKQTHNEDVVACDKNDVQTTPSGIPSQKICDALAFQVALEFTQQHEHELSCGMIPLPMQVFALMPFRHANTLERLTHVQTCIHQMAERHLQCDALIRRFRKATNRRMAVLQDLARRQGTSTTVITTTTGHDVNEEATPSKTCKAIVVTIEDKEASQEERAFADDDILETFPFEADMTSASNHVVYKAMCNFLTARGILDNAAASPSKAASNKPPHPIIVSLSGGVDSMVIISVLVQIQEQYKDRLELHAVHIDYANRPESHAEATYVQNYCEQRGVSFHCRRVDEVTRGVTARDEYERVSRNARYETYRAMVRQCQSDDSSLIIGVMLGHHKGDLRENVLSNSHKGCGPLDLSGMTAVSQNDGVTIHRPFLALEKTHILEYAHTYGIPYFKDTTPHWSTRGKLRNKLLPLLEEIYGEGSLENLSTLATESDECRALFLESILDPFLDQVVHKPMGIMFPTAAFWNRSLLFWKLVLREAMHRAGLGMWSDKSVASFLERLEQQQTKSSSHGWKEGWLQCRKDYGVYLRADGTVFVLFPDSFPWRKSDFFKCEGQEVPYGKERAVTVGPWTVTAECINEDDGSNDSASLLSQKAVPSMEAFMEGRIEYYLKVPTWVQPQKDGDAVEEYIPRPLVFVSEFTKDSRPMAWKQADLKLQTNLPLLGNDPTATKALVDPEACGATHQVAFFFVKNPHKIVRVKMIRNCAVAAVLL